MICKCETLNITEKNDEQILVTVMRGFEQKASENESEGTPQPFPVEISTDIDVKLTTPRAQRLPIDFTVGDEGRILIDLKADRVKTGTTYGIEVTGVVNGSRWCAIGDSVIRITRTTERGPKQVKVDADPYEVTLWAGYVGDVVPRHLRDLEGYTALTQLLDAMGETLGKKANAEDVTAALKNIIDRFKEYVPTSDKGKAGGVPTLGADGKVPIAQLLTEGNGGLVLRSLLGAINGVATLDGGRLVWDDQLRMGWRGYYTGDIDATNIKPGIWGIDNRSLGTTAILGDELAHGILVQFCDTQHRNYRTQLLLVGRNAQSAQGDALEIYARRYLPGKGGWGEWYSSAKTEYALTKTGSKIELRKNGILVSEVADSNTTYSTMSQAEAETGTATSARTMSAKVLKSAIVKHTEDKATIDFVNSSIQTATATFRGTHDSLEELQAVEGADKNDYGYVEETDADGNKIIHRYKYVEDTGWVYEYDLNATGFTAAEWAAIKSGMTEADVEKLRALPTSEELAAELGGKMSLTRMTNTALNPDECLEPGVYENVEISSINYDLNSHWNEPIGFITGGENPTLDTLSWILFVGGRHTYSNRKVPYTKKEQLPLPDGTVTEIEMQLTAIIRYRAVMQIAVCSVTEFYSYSIFSADSRMATRTVFIPEGEYPEEVGTINPIFTSWQPMASIGDLRKVVKITNHILDILPDTSSFALKTELPDLSPYAKKEDTLDRYKVGEEVLVGEWEENGVTYDLYRKVVSFGELPNAGQKTVTHGIADKVKFVRVSAMASNGFPIPFVTQDPAKAIYLALGNNNITINTHATDRSALTADVTIEFTREKPSTT